MSHVVFASPSPPDPGKRTLFVGTAQTTFNKIGDQREVQFASICTEPTIRSLGSSAL